jgi:hypothetical protein
MNHKNLDAVIIFNNDINSENQLSDMNQNRVEAAQTLTSDHKNSKIIFAGNDVPLFVEHAKKLNITNYLTLSKDDDDVVQAFHDIRTQVLEERNYKTIIVVTTANHYSVNKFVATKIWGNKINFDFELVASGLQGFPYDYAMKSEAKIMAELMSRLEKIENGDLSQIQKILK